MTVSSLSTITEAELREGLRTCLAIPRWIDDVVAAGPYGGVDQLVDAAYRAATPLSAAEVDQAMSDHPRIGEQVHGDGRAQQLSRLEQQSSTSTDAQLADALANGNKAYERKFGRVFLIRAAGRSRMEILAELTRRTELDPDTEVDIVATELRDIAMLRIPQVFESPQDPMQAGGPA